MLMFDQARRRTDDRSGGIGRPVLAVGAAAQRHDVAHAGLTEFDQYGEGELLVATALAGTWPERDRCFPADENARREGQWLAVAADATNDPGHRDRDFARLPLDERPQV